MLKILSLGAGVQSSAVLLASEKGLLPRLDAAIFADTGWEPAAVYAHLDWLKLQTDIPIYTVQQGNLREMALTASFNPIPVFTDTGQGQRQCTYNYKMRPVRKKMRELLGGKVWNGAVQQWLGISTDETSRARISDKKWIENHFPLILDLRWSRIDCLNWLEQKYPGHSVPRSACIGCPYKSDREWLELKKMYPEEWKDACDFDNQLVGEYLHQSGKRLHQVDLNEDQQDLFINDCYGMCGV